MADKETIIGPETRVSGELRGDEDVVVRGRVEGRVHLNALFTVEDGAIVQADVEARVVLISGVLVGNVTASESVRLAERARVVGDIVAPRVVMEDGASYKGRLDMGAAAEAADAQTAARRFDDQEGHAGKLAPPRLSVPSRVAAISGAAVSAPRVTPAEPPREATVIPAPSAPPPSLPSPEDAAAGGVASAPGWAKKKLHRRS